MAGKRIKAAREAINQEKLYDLKEAVSTLKTLPSKVKFDEPIDIAINLGVDPRQSDQTVRGVTPMPHGLGKTVRVAVFAKDAKAEEAKKAGADEVGSEELVAKIQKGDMNFDRCIATPDMMGEVGKVAKLLGPRGLMPNPKLGTVTEDVAEAVKKAKSGEVEFRADKGGIVHASVGKTSFKEDALVENVKALVAAVKQAKPSGAKGTYIEKVALNPTMGPSVKVDVASV